MFILSAKLTRSKLLTFGLICCCLAIVLIVSIPQGDETTAKTKNLRGETNEQRIEYLKSFGWEIVEEPTESTEVVIPSEFDETYESYNLLQQTQGFDLSKYKGKKVMRYTYSVKNYPTDSAENVCATLLVSDKKIIGGDISSTSLGGFMHSLLKPTSSNKDENAQQTVGPTADEILASILEASSGK
ncbi:MAG: DUF4830 domain-containing protein [Ruminococcaceae bacterium]|nr:DUF4830 domain-containing protein [Oscillospiraceae bacterium]